MIRFDRFTERAQDAAARAYEILHRYSHSQVDTEHILLALLEQTDGVVPQILERLNIDVSGLRSRVDDILRQSPRTATIYGQGTNQVFITPRLKAVIDRANEEANRLRDQYISTEHIFLALLGERNTATARTFAEYNISRDRVADAVKDIRGGQRVTDPQAEKPLSHAGKVQHRPHPPGARRPSSIRSSGATARSCASSRCSAAARRTTPC